MQTAAEVDRLDGDDPCELADSLIVGATGAAGEPAAADAQDVAAVKRAGFLDGHHLAVPAKDVRHVVNLRASGQRAGPRDHRYGICYYSSIFYEDRVGQVGAHWKAPHGAAQLLEHCLVGAVLCCGASEIDRLARQMRELALVDG